MNIEYVSVEGTEDWMNKHFFSLETGSSISVTYQSEKWITKYKFSGKNKVIDYALASEILYSLSTTAAGKGAEHL